MSLQGKTALITGGTSGMGSATALAMAEKGASVIITGRDETRGASTVEKIRAGGHDAQFIAADFSEMSEVGRVADAAGEIDVLVNCAGFAALAPTADTDEAAFDGLFQINVKVPFFLVAALAPKIAARGGGSTAGKTILITGANTGLGKETARQLALRDDFERIYLGCRNPEKAERAKEDLEKVSGRKIFEVVIIDLEDLASVRAAVAAIRAPLNALAMIAGGIGGPTPASLTEDGVTEIFAQNLLGHVVLLENLLAAGLLTDVAVLAGSEGARGIPKLRIARPTFTDHSSEEFASVIDGSYFQGASFDTMLSYSQIKYLGALWMSAMARMHSELRFITMSPGNTAGTDVLRDQPALVRIIASRIVLPYLLPALRIGHKLDVGAERFVKGVTDPSLQSGVFYASAAKTITGPVIDQAEILPDFRDPEIQDHAYEAIQRFVPRRAAA